MEELVNSQRKKYGTRFDLDGFLCFKLFKLILYYDVVSKKHSIPKGGWHAAKMVSPPEGTYFSIPQISQLPEGD